METENNPIKNHKDNQKIIRALTIFACLIAMAFLKVTIDNWKIFNFKIIVAKIDDYLHNDIFYDLLSKVHIYASKMFIFLMLVNVLILIAAWKFEKNKNKLGYILHIFGVLMASLSGLAYFMVHRYIGYGKPVFNGFNYYVIFFEIVGIACTIYGVIFYSKIKNEFLPVNMLAGILSFLLIAGSLIGSGLYLWKNVSSEFKLCYEANQYIENHYSEAHSEIAYQNGNIKKHMGIYNDGYIYCFYDDRIIHRIDNEGNKEVFLSLPEGTEFYRGRLFYYDGGLYTKIYSENSSDQIIRISTTDGTTEAISTNHEILGYWGIADGKLFYEVKVKRDGYAVSDIYYMDLTKPSGPDNEALYDKNVIDSHLGYDEWFAKYIYNFQGQKNSHKAILRDVQYIGDICYIIDDDGDYLRHAELCAYKPNKDRYTMAGYIADFNTFNDTIYYVQKTFSGFDIVSCDKNGDNKSVITNIPLTPEDNGYPEVDIILGEGFMLCRYKFSDETIQDYYINIENGTYKELPPR